MSEEARHLVVDGSNLAHAWARGRGLRREKGFLETASRDVVERARAAHDFLGWAVTVVFDGNRPDRAIEHPDGSSRTLTVVYAAAGETADQLIERLLARAPATAGWLVATNDRALAQSAFSRGAEAISAEDCARWLERIGREGFERARRRAWTAEVPPTEGRRGR
jgi:predicted RNA-binding protein with PIN domain